MQQAIGAEDRWDLFRPERNWRRRGRSRRRSKGEGSEPVAQRSGLAQYM